MINQNWLFHIFFTTNKASNNTKFTSKFENVAFNKISKKLLMIRHNKIYKII